MFERLARLGAGEKLGVACAVVFVMAMIGDGLVVRPIMAYSGRLDEVLQNENGRLAYNQRVLETRGAVTAAYRNASGTLNRATVADEDLGNVKREINELARQAGLSILSTRDREPEAPGTSGGCILYTVEISKYNGTMRALLTFADRVQRTPGMLRVTRLQVAPESGTERIAGSMTLTKLMLPPEPAVEGDAAPQD